MIPSDAVPLEVELEQLIAQLLNKPSGGPVQAAALSGLATLENLSPWQYAHLMASLALASDDRVWPIYSRAQHWPRPRSLHRRLSPPTHQPMLRRWSTNCSIAWRQPTPGWASPPRPCVWALIIAPPWQSANSRMILQKRLEAIKTRFWR